MHPAQGREPFHRPGWIYEEKVDGWRILAYEDGTGVRLLSRNGIDHARRFREIVAAVAALSEPTIVLDGKLAIFDQAMRSRFELLRQSDPTIIATPPIYMGFDVLYRTGEDLSLFPLRERRKHLEEVIAGHTCDTAGTDCRCGLGWRTTFWRRTRCLALRPSPAPRTPASDRRRGGRPWLT